VKVAVTISVIHNQTKQSVPPLPCPLANGPLTLLGEDAAGWVCAFVRECTAWLKAQKGRVVGVGKEQRAGRGGGVEREMSRLTHGQSAEGLPVRA
jgi:hypothetical protein